MRVVRQFVFSVTTEWQGWLGGGLPMVCLYVVSLWKPEVLPLQTWEWFVLVFGCGLAVAVFRAYRTLFNEAEQLTRRLREVSAERPIVFSRLGISRDREGSPFVLTGIAVWFKNQSNLMMLYTFTKYVLSSDGKSIEAKLPNSASGVIHKDEELSFNIAPAFTPVMTVPFSITVDYLIEYDNIPPTQRRVTGRKLTYTFWGMSGAEISNIVDSWTEE